MVVQYETSRGKREPIEGFRLQEAGYTLDLPRSPRLVLLASFPPAGSEIGDGRLERMGDDGYRRSGKLFCMPWPVAAACFIPLSRGLGTYGRESSHVRICRYIGTYDTLVKHQSQRFLINYLLIPAYRVSVTARSIKSCLRWRLDFT